jgi:hypothetical protein
MAARYSKKARLGIWAQPEPPELSLASETERRSSFSTERGVAFRDSCNNLFHVSRRAWESWRGGCDPKWQHAKPLRPRTYKRPTTPHPSFFTLVSHSFPTHPAIHHTRLQLHLRSSVHSLRPLWAPLEHCHCLETSSSLMDMASHASSRTRHSSSSYCQRDSMFDDPPFVSCVDSFVDHHHDARGCAGGCTRCVEHVSDNPASPHGLVTDHNAYSRPESYYRRSEHINGGVVWVSERPRRQRHVVDERYGSHCLSPSDSCQSLSSTSSSWSSWSDAAT